jgi:hypothetical protein
MGLVEVGSLGYVVGDDIVMLPRFCDRVYLYCQEHGDVLLVEFAGQQHDRGSSPTLAEKNDAGRRFFLRAQIAVMVLIDQLQDAVVRRFAVAVFENANVCVFRGRFPNVLRKKNGAVAMIRVPDKPTDETYKNIRWRFWRDF